jgi:signal transduction histidine kinase
MHADFAPASALTTPDRLERVITNLLTNAIHYNRMARICPTSSTVSIASTRRGRDPTAVRGPPDNGSLECGWHSSLDG